jgi:hypothetical protein
VFRKLAAAVVMLAALTLTSCTSAPPEPAVTSAAPIPSGIAALTTKFPATFDGDSAKAETVRVADAIQALIDKATILHVDNHEQLSPAKGNAAGYYGVIRVVTVSPEVDPISLSTTIASLLRSTGWIERQTSSETDTYAMALSSNSNPAQSWFVVITGDATTKGQPVVSIQLASPDLPK